MEKKITLKDVAKKANVGLGTASRVLNNHHSVTEETAILVKNVMKELNYEPNHIARSLKTKSTGTVGIMIPDISNPFYPEVVRGIEDRANEYGYNMFLVNTDKDKSKELSYLNILKQKKVDGIIFISSTIRKELAEEFKKLEIPVVLVATHDANDEFPSVYIDNEKSAYMIVNYLCKLGHKNIAMISGSVNGPNSGPRIKGYKKALADNSIIHKDNLIFEGEHTYKSGYENMLKILENNQLIPTAIFAASDTMAVGAARAILEKGYRIPQDISIVGFDGIESAKFFYPSIATVEQPRYEMGAEGIKILNEMIKTDNSLRKKIVLSCSLKERESILKIKEL